MLPVNDKQRFVLIPPPYSISAIYHGWWTDSQYNTQIKGSWTGGATSTTDYTQSFDSNIDEDGANKVKVLDNSLVSGSGTASTYTMPVPNPNNGQYIFVGWNKNKDAKASDASGWYYRVDGKYGTGANAQITETTESVDLYAVYQRGYPINLNVSAFGGSTAQLGTMPGTSGNSYAADGNNGQEVVAITDTTNSTGTFCFPQAKHPKNDGGSPVDPTTDNTSDGMRFLGWTNDTSGGFPIDKDGNRASYYFKHENGDYTVSANGLTGAHSFSLPTANSTWYAVWESQVDFNAESYGGTINGGAVGQTDQTAKIWVKNNQPFVGGVSTPSTLTDVDGTSKATSGAFVPWCFANANYGPSKWHFKGWSVNPNPNVKADGTLGGTTGNVSALTGFTATGGNLIPNGATTYYGVWECDVSWAAPAENVVTGPAEDGSGTIASSVNAGSAANTGSFLYGYTIAAAPGTVQPASHAFLRYEDPLKRADKDITSDTGSLVVDTGGVWNAHWGPNIYKVEFKDSENEDRTIIAEDSSTAYVDGIFMKYGEGFWDGFSKDAADIRNSAVAGTKLDETSSVDGTAGLAGSFVPAPERTGFTCVGYSRDPNATAPEYFYTETNGYYEYSRTEHFMPSDAFSNSSRGVGADDATGLRVAYLYPVWRADVTWDYNNGTTSANADKTVETERLFINNRTGVWVDGQPLPQKGEAAYPQLTVRDQGARAGYKPGIGGALWSFDYDAGVLSDFITDSTKTNTQMTVEGSATATAQWAANQYDIAFNLGTLDYKGQTLAVGANYDADGNGIVDNSLTWSGNGGNEGGTVSAAAKYTVEDDRVVLPTFTRPGKQFLGWKVEHAGDSGDDHQGPGTLVGTEAVPLTNYTFATGSGGNATNPLHVRGSIELTAVWGEAEPYNLVTKVYLDGQQIVNADAIAKLFKTVTETGAFDLPDTYYASGLPLTDLTAKPGYTFAGWKAYKSATPADTMLMHTGGDPIALDASPAKQGDDATALQIAPDTTGDGAVTLEAHFTSNTYGLVLDLAQPDADKAGTGSYDTAHWAAGTSAAGDKTFSYKNDGGSHADKNGYTLYESAIQIAAPARKGQTFDGWTLQVKQADDSYQDADAATVVAVLGGTEASSTCTFSVKQDYLANYQLKARWTESKYTISFPSGLAHVNGVDGGKKTERFVAVDGTLGDNTWNDGSFGFDGDTLTGGKTVTVRALVPSAAGESADADDPDFDMTRYVRFKGWYLPEGVTALPVNDGTWAIDPANNRVYAKSIAITQANLDALFGTAVGEDGRMALTLEPLFEVKSDYNLTIDLAGGTYGDSTPSGFGDKVIETAAGHEGHATYTRTYSCEDEVALPDPTRYGHTFIGWQLTGTDLNPDAEGTVGTGHTVAKDSVGARTYTALWEAVQDQAVLYNNLKSVYPAMEEDATGQTIAPVFGQPMNTAGLTKPTDPQGNFRFMGFFDTKATTGGKQYYAVDAAGNILSARAWDKAPEFEDNGTTIIPHVLYARWKAVDAEGTADANKTQIAHGSSAAIQAKVDGDPSTTSALTAFAATYNGWLTHEATDRITVGVSSFAFTDGMTAKGVYDAFNATRESLSTDEKYLLGFVIESTGDVISFADIALGNAFEFAFKASDVADGSPAEPGFSLRSDGIYAIYSTTPFDFEAGEGGEPPSLDPVPGRSTIIALFDANSGAFEGGKTNDRTTTLYGTDASATPAQSTTVNLPSEPARKGYEFAGWARTAPHVDGDHFKDAAGTDMFAITDITTKRYFAHWQNETCEVRLDLDYDDMASTTVQVPYDSTQSLEQLGAPAAFATPTAREGYVFLGWFDDGRTKLQYFTSTGAATRAWDHEKAEGPVYLTAHWLDLNAPGSGPQSDPADVVVPDPFPGQSTKVTPAVPPNNNVRMYARDKQNRLASVALNGTYDGIFVTPLPEAADDEVAVTMYAYAPATVNDDVRHIISKYEQGCAAGEHLQGFRVASTNSFISIADLYAGKPVTFYAKGSDLEGGIAGAANLVFKQLGNVVAEYGPTQQVPPESFEGDTWPDPTATPTVPDPLPQVHNTFDARGGVFMDAEGNDQGRLMTVDATFGQPVNVPDMTPVLEDETYHFDSWCYFDADGNEQKVAFNAAGEVTSPYATDVCPMTFYARYVRTYYDFTVVDAQDGVKDVHRTDGGAERAVGSFRPYVGEKLEQMTADFAGMAESLGTRDGYDFIGYFYRTGAPGSYEYKPFYLTPESENYYAYKYAKEKQYPTDMAKLNECESGWSTLTGPTSEGNETEVTLYALWQPITYDIKWTYNYDRELGSAKVNYKYQKDGADAAVEWTQNVEFGDKLYGSIPVIEDPAFDFAGWYTQPTSSDTKSNRVAFRQVAYSGGHDADARDEYERFSTSGDRYFFVNHATGSNASDLSFEPTGDFTPPRNEVTGNRYFEFFAGFTGTPQEYKFRVYLSRETGEEHWTLNSSHWPVQTDAVSGLKYIEDAYAPSSSHDLRSFYDMVGAKPGYSKTGWYASADANDTKALGYTLPKWSTGLKELYIGWTQNDYQVRLLTNTLDLGATAEDGTKLYSEPQGAPEVAIGWEKNPMDVNLDMDEAERTIAFPSVTGAVGYRFAGWKRCEANGKFLVDGTTVTWETYAAGRELVVNEAFIADPNNFNGAESGTIYYGAVWEPYTYEVRFYENTAGAAAEAFDAYELVSPTSTDASKSEFVLPFPHTEEVQDAFKFWAFKPIETNTESPCIDWTAGTKLTLEQLLEAQKERVDFEEVPDTATGKIVVKLYANWTSGQINGTAPLYVNVLIDPWSPNREDGEGKIITNSANSYQLEDGTWVSGTIADGRPQPVDSVAANGWVSTNSATPLRIESLMLERPDEGKDIFVSGGVDRSELFWLWVYAGGLNETADPLKISMKADHDGRTVFLRDETTKAFQNGHLGATPDFLSNYSGFADAITKDDPLLLHYDLVWDDSLENLADFENLVSSDLLDAQDRDNATNTLVPKSVAIAKLFYTIGLA